MTLNEWLYCVYKDENEFFLEFPDLPKNYIFYNYQYPRIFCNDGFNISVQGGILVYSSPRIRAKEYDSMEIGFPSEYDEIMVDNDGNNIRGFVPIKEIEECLQRHGGINPELSFEDFKSKNLQKSKYMRLKKLKRIVND